MREQSVFLLVRTRSRLSLDSDGKSVINSGFSLSQDGTLSFDESAFKTEFAKDPDTIEKLFKYETNSDGDVTDGIFKKLDEYLDRQTDTNGLLSSFGTSLDNELKALSAEQVRSQELLDARYETMFFRFAAYDSIIGGLEQQFSALNLQIQAAINAKS